MPNNDEQKINNYLAAFQQDPKAVINRQPPKTDASGQTVVGSTLFSQSAIDNKDYIAARDTQRMQMLSPAGSGFPAAPKSNDKVENLVDAVKHNKLDSMEAAGLMQSKLAESPWSDDYWAIYKGILGARYADTKFPAAANWKKNFDYIQSKPSAGILASNDAARINELSPSEKYDALIGDSSASLTQRMWAEGKGYFDSNGTVETWMGICHGWAPAAYMLARPKKTVILKAPNNVSLTFYPSDIKALASLLWANCASATRFIGGRCNDKNPPADPVTGRLTSSQCFDTNPASWHLAIVNQIGASSRSMVMDVTFDYEVWNQPVYKYSYRYFNPQLMVFKPTLAEATIDKAAFTKDKFSKFRSAQTKFVVGIAMTVSYVVETAPSHNSTDSPSNDAIRQVDYYYDLELDVNKKIIGGEWYINKHPDFLWTPAKGLRAKTQSEPQATVAWQQTQPLPQAWQLAAKTAARNESAPLAAIIEQLIKFAQ